MTLPVDLKAPVRTEVSLKSHSTFKIGGSARFFAEPETRDELYLALEFRRSEGLPLALIGRGSNLLISDSGFPGLVLSLRKFEPNWYQVEGEGLLRASSGMSLFRLAALTADLELGGAEFVCHIPGTVGGAVVMNAGFGRREHPYREMKDIVEYVTILDLEGNLVKTLHREDISFEYRKTSLDPNWIVLDVRFRLFRRVGKLVRQEIEANFAYRNSVQDLRFPSAGSTFKNPRNSTMTSGQLLDRVSMKKVRIGGAMVSERHANFFLNVDHAKAEDVLALMVLAQKRVFEEFGIELEPEIRFLG